MNIDKLIEKKPSLEFVIPVLKWLKNPESVSKDGLRKNRDAADASYAVAAANAAYAAANDNTVNAEKWINKYFNKISLTRKEVEAELFKGEEMKYNEEFFNSTKIKIESEEHSKYIQELAFKAGYFWLFSDDNNQQITKSDCCYLYFYHDGFITYQNNIDINEFNSHVNKEIFIPLHKEEFKSSTNDVVQNPSHYELFEDTQAIEIIASSMSTEAFHGYCLGNTLEYRLRAGNKDDITQDIAKADKYKELYEDFKHLCK